MARSTRQLPVAVAGTVLTAVVVLTAGCLARGDDSEGRTTPAADPAQTSASASASASGATGSGGPAASSGPTGSAGPTESPAPVPSSAAPTRVTEPAADEPVATDPPAGTTGGAVSPVVTFAGWEPSTAAVEVNGYVPGLVEGGGTCRLTLTRGADPVTDENEAEPDASTINCGLLEVAGADLAAGSWQAVLSYESPTSSGASAPVPVEVPAR
jgi:hypothetical protein